jgi:hypothetical protein
VLGAERLGALPDLALREVLLRYLSAPMVPEYNDVRLGAGLRASAQRIAPRKA